MSAAKCTVAHHAAASTLDHSGVVMKHPLLRTPILCLALLMLCACGKATPQAPAQMPPPEVGVLPVQPQNSPLTQELVGRLSPFRSADVRARVAGRAAQAHLRRKAGRQARPAVVPDRPGAAEGRTGCKPGVAGASRRRPTPTTRSAAQRMRDLAPQGYVSKADLDNAWQPNALPQPPCKQAQANVQTARINLRLRQRDARRSTAAPASSR